MRSSRHLAYLLLASGLLVGAAPLAAAAPGPHADTVGDARAQAAVLRTRVSSLQVQAEQATEAYDAAQEVLAGSVTAHLSAQRALDAARASAGSSGHRAGSRVRALYMSGGSAGLYASVLTSSDLTEVLSRLHQVGAVLDADTLATERAGSAVAHRQRAEQQLAVAAGRSTQLQLTVAARAQTVRDLLAQGDALLAQADDKVRVLAEQQQRALQDAAAARARAVLARLQAEVAARAGSTVAPGSAPAAPAGPAATIALAFARAQLGKPYVWGATGPGSYDCSGLTQASYAAAGIALPRTSRQQWYAGPHVGLADLQPGDLLFWASQPSDPATIHHEAMYLGNSLMIAAPHTGAFVQVQPVYLDGYVGAVRPATGRL